MATDANAGTLSVAITGDISNLLDSLKQAESAATTAGTAIAEALSSPSQQLTFDIGDQITAQLHTAEEAATTAGTDIAEAFTPIDAAASDAATAVGDVSTALQDVAPEAANAGDALQNVGNQAQRGGESASEAAGMFEGLGESLATIAETIGIGIGLEELGREAITAASTVQQLTTSFTFLSGSANVAQSQVEKLKEMALQLNQPFADVAAAAQKMTADLGSFGNATILIQDAANAAQVTGRSFDAVANKLDNMALSGTASAKSLQTVGLSTDQLAASMNKLSDSSDVTAANVTKAFKALDMADRIAVIQDAMGKWNDASRAFSTDMAQQWTNFKTQFEFDLEAAGNALVPFISSVESSMKDLLQAVAPAAEAMAGLIAPALADNIKGAADAVNGLATSFKDLAGAASPITGFLNPINDALQRMIGMDLKTYLSGLVTQMVGFATGLQQARDILTIAAATFELASGKAHTFNAALLDVMYNENQMLPPTKAAGDGIKATGDAAADATPKHITLGDAVGGVGGKASQAAKDGGEFVQWTKSAADGSTTVKDALSQIASGFGTLTPLQVAANAAAEKAAAVQPVLNTAYERWSQDLGTGRGVMPQVITDYDNFNDRLNQLGQGFNQSYAQEVQQMHGLSGLMNSIQLLTGSVGDGTGKFNSMGVAIADVGKVVVETSGKVTDLAGAVADANDKWDAHAAKAETAAQKLQDVAAAALAAGDSVNQMAKDVENAAEAFLQLQGAASASIDSVNSATSEMGGTGGKGAKAAGAAGGAESILGMYAAEGVLGETLDHLAQAMGLVVVGFNQYMTPAAYDAAYGLNAVKAASASAATDLVNLEALGMSTKDAQAEMTKLEQEANRTGESLAALVTAFINAHSATTATTTAITGLGTAVSGSTGTTPVMIALAGAAGTAASNLTSAANAAGGLAVGANTATAAAADLAGNFGKMSAAVVDTTSALGGLVASAADLAGNFGKMAAGMLGPIDTTDTALENLAKQSNATAEAFLKLNGGLGSIGASGGNLFAGNNPGSAPWSPPSTVPWSSFGFGPSNAMGTSNIQINVTSPTHQTIASQIVQALRNNAGLKL
jgi:methyl-accepting chemotaxis protein